MRQKTPEGVQQPPEDPPKCTVHEPGGRKSFEQSPILNIHANIGNYHVFRRAHDCSRVCKIVPKAMKSATGREESGSRALRSAREGANGSGRLGQAHQQGSGNGVPPMEERVYHLCLQGCVHIYIYIYIHGKREREREQIHPL